MTSIIPPWTLTLTGAEHDLILFAMAAASLALLATLVRLRFSPSEAHGTYRMASLTANSVVAIAFVSYLALITAFMLTYRQQGHAWVPVASAKLAWEIRYVDWIVTVPLLMIEVIAISTFAGATAAWARRVGIAAAIGMTLAGFLGAFIVNDGTVFASYALLGVVGALCFAILYALIVASFVHSLPRLPALVRPGYRAAILVLLPTWFVYPAVYGLAGIAPTATAVVVGQVLLCVADVVAKVGFGTLVHRVSVLRSRAEEDLDPATIRRPRVATADSMWVDDRDLTPLPPSDS